MQELNSTAVTRNMKAWRDIFFIDHLTQQKKGEKIQDENITIRYTRLYFDSQAALCCLSSSISEVKSESDDPPSATAFLAIS